MARAVAIESEIRTAITEVASHIRDIKHMPRAVLSRDARPNRTTAGATDFPRRAC